MCPFRYVFQEVHKLKEIIFYSKESSIYHQNLTRSKSPNAKIIFIPRKIDIDNLNKLCKKNELLHNLNISFHFRTLYLKSRQIIICYYEILLPWVFFLEYFHVA